MKLLTAEAARLIGVTPATVRLMERRGELQAERTESGVRLFDRTAIEQIAKDRTARRARSAQQATEAA